MRTDAEAPVFALTHTFGVVTHAWIIGGDALRVLAGVSCADGVIAGARVFHVAMSSSTGGPEISLGPTSVG